ncbi:hypothetical protein GHV40_00980 [Devosia sp. D6-9]|nr:hypothetical protein GHV40_00980 [Devosia sp. D6-9]
MNEETQFRPDWAYAIFACSIPVLIALLFLIFCYVPIGNRQEFWLGTNGVVGAVVGLGTLAGVVAAARQAIKAYEHSRAAEVAARFQKGADLLATERETSRIGGLFILRDVASAAPEQYYIAVADLLCAFASERTAPMWEARRRLRKAMLFGNTRLSPQDELDLKAVVESKTPADAAIAIEIIGKLRGNPRMLAIERKMARTITFRRVLVNEVEVNGADFRSTTWEECVFGLVAFRGCNFQLAVWRHTPVSGKMLFSNCNLQQAKLYAGRTFDGSGARVAFSRCDLSEAFLDVEGLDVSVARCRANKLQTIGTFTLSFNNSWVTSADARPNLYGGGAPGDSFRLMLGTPTADGAEVTTFGMPILAKDAAEGMIEVLIPNPPK